MVILAHLCCVSPIICRQVDKWRLKINHSIYLNTITFVFKTTIADFNLISLFFLLLVDAQKSQFSSLSDGESFECYGESESADTNSEGLLGVGGAAEAQSVNTSSGSSNNSMSRLSSQSMMATSNGGGGGGNGGGMNQLSPVASSDSSAGDPELSINNNG